MGSIPPFTPASPVRELSVRAFTVGLVLSVVMGAANVYLGLKVGMTVSASIPAAVLGMLILRAFFRGGTVLEANQIQTAASAGESLAAGVIFTMPALVLLGAWTRFDPVMTTAIACAGGLLGILFMIPMRRVFITNNRELAYPEAVACAAVLRASDGAGGKIGARAVLGGAIIGALGKALVGIAGVVQSTLETAFVVGERTLMYGGFDVSPALVGVGFIVRLEVAMLIFIGGALGWLLCIPLLSHGGALHTELLRDPVQAAWSLWKSDVRYMGVGAMVVGGLVSIFKVRRGLVQAVRELKNTKARAHATTDEKDRDLSLTTLVGLLCVSTVAVAWVYWRLTGSPALAGASTVIMLVMSFFFTAVASYIVGLVGNSNSPVSGMTITTVLFTGLMLYIAGFSGTHGMIATLGVAAIVCCVTCSAGDMCNDLKTGHLIGASPRRQQLMQIAGVVIASLAMAPTLQLLQDTTVGGIGGRELPAPQASLFASLARGFFGDATLPWNRVAAGAVVALCVTGVDAVLERRRSRVRLPVMPIAIGVYLPFGLATPILIGGLLSWWLERRTASVRPSSDSASGTHHLSEDESTITGPAHLGVLVASGTIAGESLMGISIALMTAARVSHANMGWIVLAFAGIVSLASGVRRWVGARA